MLFYWGSYRNSYSEGVYVCASACMRMCVWVRVCVCVHTCMLYVCVLCVYNFSQVAIQQVKIYHVQNLW